MKRSGFSMIELVFVIVILGVLAAVAVPRFSTTRVDAQVATLRSDIATALKAVPARVFAENIEVTGNANQVKDPTGKAYAGWGEFILDTSGLDRGRWQATGSGIIPIATKTSNNANVTCSVTGNAIGLIAIAANTGNLTFNPTSMSTTTGPGKALCDALKSSYPSGSDRVIPLAATGNVKF